MQTEAQILVKSAFTDPKQFEPEHVVLIGSGANTFGWNTVFHAIEEQRKNCGGLEVLEEITQNLDLELVVATCSFNYRMIRDQLLLELINGTLNTCALQKYVPHLEWFYEFRKKIGLYYNSGSGELRPSLLRLLSAIDLEKTAFVTSNWDLLLWKNQQIKNLIQLHGRADYPDSLIFPTELSTDENLLSALPLLNGQQLMRPSQVSSSVEFKKFVQASSRGVFAKSLRSAHEMAINWTSSAKKITCIGIAFNTYDAELNSVLRRDRFQKLMSLDIWDITKKTLPRVKQIFRVDPEYFPQEGVSRLFHSLCSGIRCYRVKDK